MRVVADRFGYIEAYVRVLRHQFRHGKVDPSKPVSEGHAARRRISAEVRRQIRAGRENNLSAGETIALA